MINKLIVLIPTLNSNKTLWATLVHLDLAAMEIELKVIVIDGGSIDRSLKTLAQIWPPIKVIKHEGKGLASARNRAIYEAIKEQKTFNADYWLFLDSDVMIPSDFFRRLIFGLKRQDNIATAELNADFTPNWEGWQNPADKMLVPRYYHAVKGMTPDGNKIGIGNATICTLMNPEAVEKVFMDERFVHGGEDIDFHLQLAEMGYKGFVDYNRPWAWHIRTPSLLDEVKKLFWRGNARALNLKLHKKYAGHGVLYTLLACAVTSGSLLFIINPFILHSPLSLKTELIPLSLLYLRQLLKLKKPWQLHWGLVGLFFSFFYLGGASWGFLRYWVFEALAL